MRATRGDQGAVIKTLGEMWLESLPGGRAGGTVCSPAGLWGVLAGAEGRVREEVRGVLGPDVRESAAVRELSLCGAFSARTGPGRQPGEGDPALGGLLVQDVTLNGWWEHPFDPAFTRVIAFTDAGGVIHQVPAMVAEVPVEDAWTVRRAQGRVRVVELRAHAEQRTTPAGPCMRVRLALAEDPRLPPTEVIAASWAPAAEGARIRGGKGQGGRQPEAILLELPRLALRADVDASPFLAEIGVRGPASPSAGPSGAGRERPDGGRTVQRCSLRLDEAGLSSLTGSDAVDPHPPARYWTDGPGELVATVPMRFDRPFAVSVLDGSGTIPLLAAYRAGPPSADR